MAEHVSEDSPRVGLRDNQGGFSVDPHRRLRVRRPLAGCRAEKARGIIGWRIPNAHSVLSARFGHV